MIPLSRAVGSARQKSFEEQWGEIEKGCGFTSLDNESPLPSTWTAHRRLGDGRGDKMTSGQSRSALLLDRSCPVFMTVGMTTEQTGRCDAGRQSLTSNEPQDGWNHLLQGFKGMDAIYLSSGSEKSIHITLHLILLIITNIMDNYKD